MFLILAGKRKSIALKDYSGSLAFDAPIKTGLSESLTSVATVTVENVPIECYVIIWLKALYNLCINRKGSKLS